MNITTAQITSALQSGKVTSTLNTGTGFLQSLSASIAAPLGLNQIVVLILLSVIIGAVIKEWTGLSFFTMTAGSFVLLMLLKIGLIS